MATTGDGKEFKEGSVLNIPVKVLEYSEDRAEVELVNDPRIKFVVPHNVMQEIATTTVEKQVEVPVEKIVETIKYNDVPQDVIEKIVKETLNLAGLSNKSEVVAEVEKKASSLEEMKAKLDAGKPKTETKVEG